MRRSRQKDAAAWWRVCWRTAGPLLLRLNGSDLPPVSRNGFPQVLWSWRV